MFLQTHQFLGVKQIPYNIRHCLHFNIEAILVALSAYLSCLLKLDHICFLEGSDQKKIFPG